MNCFGDGTLVDPIGDGLVKPKMNRTVFNKFIKHDARTTE